MSDLMLLAGQSPAAQALLQAAAEGVISGPDLEAHLLNHASPAVFVAGLAEALWLGMELETNAQRWWDFQNDPKTLPDWTAEQVDAEVLSTLFRLITGRHACRWCLCGWLSTVDHLEPEGDCSQHTTKQVAA